ncbi:unnamed protein product [Diabrotica balteata]|uniref:DUF7869 domain-containing protein n=1 Tax=Diabrotica balteata TaxID=107213 RepID=A0A9N9SW10_DIABA|nr:unnamed protein product [Diabrotica balteata]
MHLTYLWIITVASCIAQAESKIQDTPTIYHNQFAVYIPDGHAVADTIAAKYGFTNAGQTCSCKNMLKRAWQEIKFNLKPVKLTVQALCRSLPFKGSLPSDIQYDQNGHTIVREEEGRSKTNSVYICGKCKVYLHADCFSAFHKKLRSHNDASAMLLLPNGCGGQNKNKTMIVMLHRWLLFAPKNVEEIQLIFPVRGHSFTPPDRLFGLCEKDFNKKEIIETPDGYVKLIEKYATIRRLGINVDIFDWNQEAVDHFKPISQWHFKFQPSKNVQFKRAAKSQHMILIQAEQFYYHSIGNFKFIMKGKENVSLASDKRLLELHFESDWQSNPCLKFYVNFFCFL